MKLEHLVLRILAIEYNHILRFGSRGLKYQCVFMGPVRGCLFVALDPRLPMKEALPVQIISLI